MHVYTPAPEVVIPLISNPFELTSVETDSDIVLPVRILEKEGVDGPDETQGSSRVFPTRTVTVEGGAWTMVSSLDAVTACKNVWNYYISVSCFNSGGGGGGGQRGAFYILQSICPS